MECPNSSECYALDDKPHYVQWDGSDVEEWYYYEELELIEYE